MRSPLRLLFSLMATFSLTATADTAPQSQFFDSLSALCGQAFEGEIVIDNAPPSPFTTAKLIMHVRSCTDNELQIPFHVGDDASRTWIITKTHKGLQLKHDHRHEDGSSDVMTMYGGHTIHEGWPQVQTFPADNETKELFVREAIPQSITNTWQIYIYPKFFTYRMARAGREFRVDFDLNKPVSLPPIAWGYKGD